MGVAVRLGTPRETVGKTAATVDDVVAFVRRHPPSRP